MTHFVYKVLTAAQLQAVEAGGFMEAPVDIADGFVHFSTSQQVQETLNKWFKGQAGCVIAAVSCEEIGAALRWEISRGGDWFPHVYARLSRRHIKQLWSLDTFNAEGAPSAPRDVTDAPEPASKPAT